MLLAEILPFVYDSPNSASTFLSMITGKIIKIIGEGKGKKRLVLEIYGNLLEWFNKFVLKANAESNQPGVRIPQFPK